MPIKLREREVNAYLERRAKADEVNRYIFGENYNPNRYTHIGLRYFEMPTSYVKDLVRNGLLSRDDSHGGSPTVGELLDFVSHTDCPNGWSFEGYCVSPDVANSPALYINAIYTNDADLTRDDLCLFAETFRYADAFEVRPYTARAYWQ